MVFIGSNLIIKIIKDYKNYKILNLDCNTYASNIKKLKFLKKIKDINIQILIFVILIFKKRILISLNQMQSLI